MKNITHADKQFFDMFRRRRDKMNAEDERETPGEYRVQ